MASNKDNSKLPISAQGWPNQLDVIVAGLPCNCHSAHASQRLRSTLVDLTDYHLEGLETIRSLNAKQQRHVAGASPETRQQMTDYLTRGVEVVVFRQNECGDDVPPFAVAPVEKRDFWIGCWDTVEQATTNATDLRLRVVLNESSVPSSSPAATIEAPVSPCNQVIELSEVNRCLEAANGRVLGLMRDARDQQAPAVPRDRSRHPVVDA